MTLDALRAFLASGPPGRLEAPGQAEAREANPIKGEDSVMPTENLGRLNDSNSMARQISLDWARHFDGADADKVILVAEKFYAYLIKRD